MEPSGAGLPRPGTLQHTVTLGVFRLQQVSFKFLFLTLLLIITPCLCVQGLNQLAAKLSQPESLLADAASLVTGQPAAQDKLGVAAASNPVSVVMDKTAKMGQIT